MGRTILSRNISFVCFACIAVNCALAKPLISSATEKSDKSQFYCNETRRLEKREDLAWRKSKVLNFFAVPPSRECLADDGRRSGVCFNPYECKLQNGEPRGQCARGFGVCCVFTATCGDEIVNNITYFVNPGFPGLHTGAMDCEVKIKKMASHVGQLRLDFVHFNMGQPNRRTGNCETDLFILGGVTKKKKNNLKFPSREMRLCGQNSGHHIYYDVDNFEDSVSIRMNLTKEHIGRLWEIKVTQIRFNQRAPAGCLQYHRGITGIIQTMNFADNGRHLANQDYSICMRQEEGFCSIAYEPCDENSFKIGPPLSSSASPLGSGPLGTNPVGGGPLLGSPPGTNPILGVPGGGPGGIGAGGPGGIGGLGPGGIGGLGPGGIGGLGPGGIGGGEPVGVLGDDPGLGQEPVLADEEGSGTGELDGADAVGDGVDAVEDGFLRQTPQNLGECADRIVMPCDSEEFIAAEANGPGVCDLLHCGSSFCTGGEDPCRIESSTTPFLIQVQFGPGLREESPEDNLGMCLRYEQLPCN